MPAVLHRELVRKSGIANEDEADAELRAWYRQVSDAWEGRAVGEDDFAFWRARWKERTQTSGPANRAPTRTRALEGVWGEVLDRLLIDLGRHNLEQWFSGVRVLRTTDELLVLEVPTDTQRDWIRRHYLDQLTAAAEAARPGMRVELDLAEAA